MSITEHKRRYMRAYLRRYYKLRCADDIKYEEMLEYHRKYIEDHKDQRDKENYRSWDNARNQKRKGTPEEKARFAVRYAIVTGKLARPTVCSTCSKDEFKCLAVHDNGYEDPFDIRWVCTRCRGKERRKYAKKN